jgi:hypothetical protein
MLRRIKKGARVIGMRASRAQLISILRLLIGEANPAPFAAAPSSGSSCRTVAPASAPDANL